MRAKPPLKPFLEACVKKFNTPRFIENDPVCIPHLFVRKQDIEIAGFFAALFAWGQRTTIINKCRDLLNRMDDAPYQFVLQHNEADLQRLVGFRHRTFNDTDLLYFVSFFNYHYRHYDSLEAAFTMHMHPDDLCVENGLNGFRKYFFGHEPAQPRTFRHLASPALHSACKRINMFLRWMVRSDHCGVDFGLWNTLRPHQLVCPLDVHVQRVALQLGLLQRTQADWKAALELTTNLREMDPKDPVKYDFALFGLGVSGDELPRL